MEYKLRETRYIAFLVDSIYTNGKELTYHMIKDVLDKEKRKEHIHCFNEAMSIVNALESK